VRHLGSFGVALHLVWLLAGCGGALAMGGREAAKSDLIQQPALRLPSGVRPLAYTLEVAVLPRQERFSGRTQIAVELAAPSDKIWLHGKDLNVSDVHAMVAGQRIQGSSQQRTEDGLASLQFVSSLPAGRMVIELRYDAAFDRQLEGLYRLEQDGESYAFTQFEAISARRAFPCFDEPEFKTPFEVWLTVGTADTAITNTLPIAEDRSGNFKRVHFAQTKPLPTYLLAWAVGPLDVVEAAPLPANDLRATPIPVRGVATKGHGAELAHALGTLGPIVQALESYFALAYPYDKLDVVAVPDFAAGAMENAAMITFRDSLLLVDAATASEGALRRDAFTLAHELAHQWVGDLVTMHFWEDIWLNEAFATWLEYRVIGGLHPEYKGELELVEDMQEAMGSDSRVTARVIRQPIVKTHDIMNAFDSITYSKGGGVIGMFERYLGPNVFQQGVRAYIREHAYGNADTDDLLRALSEASGRDIAPAFNGFLTQPGVPLIETQLSCSAGQPAQLKLRQSRYLPIGSDGERKQTWEIPVCARYELAGTVRESCTLMTTPEAWLILEGSGCPMWIMPNADGAGYYRFSMASADLERLRTQGAARLNARERYVLLQSLIAGFEANTVSADDLLGSLGRFASDDERLVAVLPLDFLRDLREHWLGRPGLEPSARTIFANKFAEFVRRLYAPVAQRLGVTAKPGESGEQKLLRAQVLGGMCDLAEEASTRAALGRSGRQYLGLDTDAKLHPEAVPNELAIERGRYLAALASVRDYRAEKALALTLDSALRVNEVMVPLQYQLADYRTRTAAYAFLERSFDLIGKRVSPAVMAWTPWLAAAQCDQTQADSINAFFEPRIESLPGGPRSLGGALEALALCDAQVRAHGRALDAFFSKL
jgi:alanyl aminopeptidase